MGSLRIESQRRQHPRKSDLEIAEKLAREHGYIAVVRYKNSPTAQEHTDFGTCRTAEELHSYLRSTYCHNVEILFDGRDKAFSERGRRNRADDLPVITPEVLHETFVAYNEATLRGAGIKKLKETTEHWNKRRYGKAFKLLTRAVSLGLEARAEAGARCLLGQIYIKRRQLEAALSELIQCLKLPERTYAGKPRKGSTMYTARRDVIEKPSYSGSSQRRRMDH